MATFTWIAATPTGADWLTPADWTPTGVPGTTAVNTDVVTFGNNTTGSGTYVVQVAHAENIDVATINLSNVSSNTAPTLNISGNLSTTTLHYDATSGGDLITIAAGGVFDIRNSITETGTRTETITINAHNAGGSGTGGHLELGGLTVDNANLTYSFSNNGATLDNTGEIEFQSGFIAGATTSQHITNLAWGDEFVFDGANFTGDTATVTGGALIVKNGAGATVLTMKNVTMQGGAANSFQLVGNRIAAVCYSRGTRILTMTGERMVESLMQGDIVLTLSGGELIPQRVKWIGQRRIDLTAHPQPETVAPIRIQRDAFADNMPRNDLLVSPDHAIFVDGKLICARQLINGTTIRQEKTWASVEYFHVKLESHAILLAEGLPAESYLDTGNQGFFANAGAPLVLHPDLTDETDYPTREAASCAPFVSDEGNVRPVWQRLSDRAASLGQPAPKLETVTDADLLIVAKGRAVRPLYGENGLYIFALPKGATDVRLVSRAASPADARPWLEDRRRLGVSVERIVLRDAQDMQTVAVDDPGLLQGWWAAEQDATGMHRWTNGNATLKLPASRGPTLLEIRVGNGGLDYVANTDQDRRVA
jgi:Hint domain